MARFAVYHRPNYVGPMQMCPIIADSPKEAEEAFLDEVFGQVQYWVTTEHIKGFRPEAE